MAGMRNDTAKPPEGELQRLRAETEALRARLAELEKQSDGELPLAELVSRIWREGQRETRAG